MWLSRQIAALLLKPQPRDVDDPEVMHVANAG